MAAPLRMTLFGPFRLAAAGAEIGIPAAKQRALLALIALEADGRLGHERVISLLWGDRGEAQARDSLKHALADLRATLNGVAPGLLASQRGVVTLDPAGIAVDAQDLAAALAGTDNQALRHALETTSGELLEGLVIRDPAFEDWLRDERTAWQVRKETGAARLLSQAVRGGDGATIASAARQMLALNPFHEEAARALMLQLAMTGDKTAALRLHARLAARLRTELQAGPEPETAALAEAIRSGNLRPGTGAPASATLRGIEKPSIAVLPFRNLSRNPDEDYLAEGIAEDIVTALSQYRWFFVIARNSSFLYGDRRGDMRGIAAELGVRYILDGSVRRMGTRVRLTGELIEPETGFQVWGGSYDRDLSDIFALQEDLARRVVGAIEPEILRGESQRAAAKPAANLDAYDCHMRGVWYHNRQNRPEDFDDSIRWQTKAVELDPTLARAWMIMSRSIYARALHGFSTDLDRDRRDLLEAATRAVSLEDRDSYAHYAMCLAHLLDQQPGAAVLEAERSTELSVNFALGHNALGWARIFAGQFAGALEPIATAMRLSPVDPVGYFFNAASGLAHYHLGQYDEAARHAQRGYSAKPRYFNMLVLLAALGQLGRTSEAGSLGQHIRMSRPPDFVRYWRLLFPYRDPAHRDHLRGGLLMAGYAPEES